jgi:NAD(P)-dependent dehydrogenase (short-subunit alcohol dehydrogenase family)/DNA-binding transcriptional regulator YbjK
MKTIPTTIKNQKLVEQRRKQIVLAAIKLFSEKGFHKTTLRELADEANLSYGNIYDYVGSKEDIFSLIHDYAANLAIRALKSSIENVTNPVEKLRRIIRTEFSLMVNLSDAILLIYQDSHILSKPYLHKLLCLEREHLHLIEQTIEECIDAGRLVKCNVRLTANLIKSMIDSWVIKRWDLRGFADRLETERAILELIFNGINSGQAFTESKPTSTEKSSAAFPSGLNGQTALIINSGTPIGTALCHSLSIAGVKIAVYADSDAVARENPVVCKNDADPVRFYSPAFHGKMDAHLFELIEKDMGSLDIYLHEIGVGTLKLPVSNGRQEKDRLMANLRSAEGIASFLQSRTNISQPRRVVYIAPWRWDQFHGAIPYAAVQGAVLALTESLARHTANRGMTVNCVAPGFISTARPSSLQKQFKEKIKASIPAGCFGEIRDIVETALFLAGDSAKYITGQVFKIDGGGEYPLNEIQRLSNVLCQNGLMSMDAEQLPSPDQLRR